MRAWLIVLWSKWSTGEGPRTTVGALFIAWLGELGSVFAAFPLHR
jgi:hypothetical protein